MRPKPQTLNPEPQTPAPTEIAAFGYQFIRLLGFILDEASSQGLELWREANGSWGWRWHDSSALAIPATQRFWAMGEALIDALVQRHPRYFATETDDPPTFASVTPPAPAQSTPMIGPHAALHPAEGAR